MCKRCYEIVIFVVREIVKEKKDMSTVLGRSFILFVFHRRIASVRSK
jgi:hypothetical protein